MAEFREPAIPVLMIRSTRNRSASICAQIPALTFLAERACRKVNPEIHVFTGRVVSGDQFIADSKKKDFLINQFTPLCTEMEGAAIAQAAYLNGIPFLIIRAISDKADNSAQVDYPVFEAAAIEHSVRLVTELAAAFED